MSPFLMHREITWGDVREHGVEMGKYVFISVLKFPLTWLGKNATFFKESRNLKFILMKKKCNV